MNSEKTQVIWLGTRQKLAKVDINVLQLSSAKVLTTTAVVDLGLTIDSRLTMSDHIAAVRRSCFFQLRQLQAVRRSLTTETTKVLIHAFVHEWSPRLLQQPACWRGQRPYTAIAVSSECGCTVGHGPAQVRPYYSSAAGIALAARPEAYRLQGSTPRLQVPAWTRPIIFG